MQSNRGSSEVESIASEVEVVAVEPGGMSAEPADCVIADEVAASSIPPEVQTTAQPLSSSDELSWLVQSASASAIVSVEATAVMDGPAVVPNAVVLHDGSTVPTCVARAEPPIYFPVLEKGMKATEDSGRVVRAEDVFVSSFSVGDKFSKHRLSAVYGKLVSEYPVRWFMTRKIVIVGDAGVGKTRLWERLTGNVHIGTTIMDFRVIGRGYSGDAYPASYDTPVPIKVQLWDFDGPERHPSNLSVFYRGMHGIFLCYNVADRESFANVRRWHSWHVEEVGSFSFAPPLVFVVLGLQADHDLSEKSDTEWTQDQKDETDDQRNRRIVSDIPPPQRRHREVSYAEGLELATSLGCPFLECSARDDTHVQDALATMIHHLVRVGVREDILTRPPPSDQRATTSPPCSVS